MITNAQVVLFMLVLTRVSAFIAFFPLFSKKQLPSLVKAGLAGALSLFWFCQIEANMGPTEQVINQMSGFTGCMLLIKEGMIGIVLAIAMGLFFWPARIAGSYVGQELGLSMASISDPGSQDSSTLLSRIFETFAILLFFALNLHHFLILVIHHSFENVISRGSLLELPTERLVGMLNGASDYGLMIVAPLLIGFMLVTLVLAFLNRAAPTLNLFSIGMPLRVGLGILCL
ncbi:MAG: flagellar biosynthetic protein FliR, partial [Pirellulaceae bacterium]|nr:flagellar biosynthetic protein FliR [Pirellulaceae bacterium]